MSALEADHQLARRSAFDQPVEDWSEVAAAIVRISAAKVDLNGGPQLDVPGKTAFYDDIITRLYDAPGELAVFYDNINGDTEMGAHAFTAVVPDQKRPLDVSFRFDKSNPSLQNTAYALGINYAVKKQSTHSNIAGAREIVVSGGSQSVWMGAGVQARDISLEPLYPVASAAKRLCIGSDEIAELFTEIAGSSRVDRTKLFGGLFHIALLADDFEAAIPNVPALDSEAVEAQMVLETRHKLSARLLSINQPIVTRLKEVQSDFGRGRAALSREIREESAHLPPASLPYMGDQRTWPYIDVHVFEHDVNVLNSTLNALEKEVAEHRRRAAEYMRWFKIIDKIRGR